MLLMRNYFCRAKKYCSHLGGVHFCLAALFGLGSASP
jgi:hypothetical protein